MTLALVGILVAGSAYVYVVYFEPQTSCRILQGSSGVVYWTLRNATPESSNTSQTCFQFEQSGHGQLVFGAGPRAVDITMTNGFLNSDSCRAVEFGEYCPRYSEATLVIAWNTTSGVWEFNHTADAYGTYAMAFGFVWENQTSPPPQEWVNFTLSYGP